MNRVKRAPEAKPAWGMSRLRGLQTISVVRNVRHGCSGDGRNRSFLKPNGIGIARGKKNGKPVVSAFSDLRLLFER
jgi:hypothetical protein